ncbi:GNAT family N-acetyltransferase [Ponticoccus sp. SC2-23]|uniref:GNAT family N-acetyltransferase n=1 Tax=Alexandriicola marinus TaxID=2081710 RepID=UPI000FD6C94D|nr:GNAT family N-acetyltransferase [Alexandriicola marinus]MBM1222852.1 GNAT family N-acetyltransferase [Ponticoccus sp. SC6-9]MBM1227234.1 GNAT family N-acetyltransferase [Ponticoccus sp. SC6-15]MBM1231778.1 GNAT family N-acetyltransferase [Ponticoccus sp. SC6-38]MBM1236351.1 GNAT family N-acetyltransferase [Ponticoccus sp. SC6-45]MBM1240801.1 GNAT family N-acetyltransferase [Ponticoccus sp. SC6-49]MBM1245336.1 GNAT family N-acetyltransferase [Ponticoccus sp. SC2-64]MBM1249824.1 GNAT family
MSEPFISIEPISDELLAAYKHSGMELGKAGAQAIEWAFGSNPSPFAVARHEGAIVGISGYIQSHMQFGKTGGTAVQAVDSFVSETMRGKGIFTRLAQAYDEHARHSGVDLVWGFPNDNAAPAWYGKLGWHRHGEVPFMIKPLRAGFISRKLRLPLDFPLTFARDQRIDAVTRIGGWGDTLWEKVAPEINVGTIRDRAFLQHRLVDAPQASAYRVVVDTTSNSEALVATREADKHGGRIAYVMEALGAPSLQPLLMSELGRLASRGVEVALVWSFPWSPNYRALRKAGFMPLPERLRPIRIWLGSTPKTTQAERANQEGQWYLSYLDSDTV